MEVEETTFCFIVVGKSWIPIHEACCRCWLGSIVSFLTLVAYQSFVFLFTPIVNQWFTSLETLFSWANQACGTWLPFFQQQFLVGLFSLTHVPASLQLANLFTKALSGPSHHTILPKLGLSVFSSNLRGCWKWCFIDLTKEKRGIFGEDQVKRNEGNISNVGAKFW